MAALSLLGLVGVLQARRKRRRGGVAEDAATDNRISATMETERRMAAYLASRDMRGEDAGPMRYQNEGASDERR